MRTRPLKHPKPARIPPFRPAPLAMALAWAVSASAEGPCPTGGHIEHAPGAFYELCTLGGSGSYASVSANGNVVVGSSATGVGTFRAFRWTSSGGLQDLGTLGGDRSHATAVSADGNVVVGWSETGDGNHRVFRWTSAINRMEDLGHLGGRWTAVSAVSADGNVVVGWSRTGDGNRHAFRWTSARNRMEDLGTLGGGWSSATAVSADGNVVVGESATVDGYHRAFRWTSSDGMQDLGTLGGVWSYASAVSADGNVVVGESGTSEGDPRAFRWTQATGMQSVEEWLRAAGIQVPEHITTSSAVGVSADGNVVVGHLQNGRPFWARVSGLITLDELDDSLQSVSLVGHGLLTHTNLMLQGAYSRPLSRRVGVGQNTFWLTGDWGRDDHGSRSGDLGLAALGLGRNYGPAQLNLSLGRTWARQKLILDGRAESDANFLLAEGLIPLQAGLWGVISGYYLWGEGDIRRGYNAPTLNYSNGSPDIRTWGLRGRLEWNEAWKSTGTTVSPYADLSYYKAKMQAYTETGGAFPARFNARKDKATELRLGVDATHPLAAGHRLIATVEAAHRFEKEGGNVSGEVIGLFPFNLSGTKNQRDWLRAGLGVEGGVGRGTGQIMLNATTKGEAPSVWLNAGWRMSF